MMGKFPVRCLVTGGAGFIGSHLAIRLSQEGHQVTVLDKSGAPAPLPGIAFVEGDVRDAQLVRALVGNHDCVYHMAALLGVRRTLEDPAGMLENNLAGTLNVLKAAWTERKKVLFASTSEAYGKGTPPFLENMDLVFGPTQKLRWSYAVCKTVEEYLCLGYGKKGLPVTIVRYFNIYGPRQTSSMYGGVVAKFIKAALVGQDIPVYGDGSQTRSFTYIADAVEGTIAAMQQEADQEVVNIGTQNEMTIMELAVQIKRLAGSSSNIVKVPYHEVFPQGFEEISRRVPGMDKAKKLLGFAPQVCLEDGLRETIEWFRQNLQTS
jgi:UDP-glucose 4-epimerase